MNDNIWDIETKEIIEQDLTEEDKKIAEYCSDIEMSIKETISIINTLDQ